MNFEELLETRDVRKTTKVRLPYGYFYKRLIDGKYSNFVEFHDEVADHVAFSNCVRTEAADMEKIANKHQLHFVPNEGDGGVYAIAVEVGNFITFEQLLNENPAVMAREDFANNTLRDLVEITQLLNDKGVYHVCFAPGNVLVRKNDDTVRLLCHGSFYAKLDQETLYDGLEDYVAPEVLAGGEIDARADVYALAKFVAWLYHSAGLPLVWRPIIAKATAQDPSRRYQSVHDFYQALVNRKNMFRTALVGFAAIAIALVIVGGYFYMLPQPENVEYVKAVEEPIPDDMLDEENLLYGLGADADSATIANIVAKQMRLKDSLTIDEKEMKAYQAKAEQIFRKQFTKEADRILSKIYNNEKMNLSEKEFMARSRSMTQELAKAEQELAKHSNLGNERSQRIASEIIDQLTTKKMEALDKDYMGIKKNKTEKK
jgi:serine/threonine protein kinase